jgi:hypothetical protein
MSTRSSGNVHGEGWAHSLARNQVVRTSRYTVAGQVDLSFALEAQLPIPPFTPMRLLEGQRRQADPLV